MLPRERVHAAISRTGPDRPPLSQSASDGVLCELGQPLLDLWRRYPQDFGDLSERQLPACPPNGLAPSYHATSIDEWGVTWEFRIFGMHGHPRVRPLDDLRALDAYQAPPPPPLSGPGFEAAREQARRHRERHYLLLGWLTIFEVLHAVRRFEDVLMDIADDAEHLHRIADLIVSFREAEIAHYLALGADGLMFADDWGTAQGPIISREQWRRLFRPRYERMMAPVHAAGRHVWYHSCGVTEWLWEELAELGIHVFWPQLTAVDNAHLAAWCRERRVTLFAHPDRANLMPRGTPEQVRAEVRRIAETFGSREGGLIFQGEVDRGFRIGNVEALYDEVCRL